MRNQSHQNRPGPLEYLKGRKKLRKPKNGMRMLRNTDLKEKFGTSEIESNTVRMEIVGGRTVSYRDSNSGIASHKKSAKQQFPISFRTYNQKVRFTNIGALNP
jgi:hypothetical protein